MAMASSTKGFLYALGAYLLWGVFPLYWKQLAEVDARVLVAHRVLWSFAVLALFLVAKRRWPEVLRAATAPSVRRLLLLSTVLISANWLVFIYAVNTERVLSASLGYYMNPLLNVLLGGLVLGERLRPLQMVSVGLAFCGVVNLAVAQGGLPWISLVLASTFALYGLVRRTAAIESIPGLAVETGLVAPVALLFLLFWPGVAAVPDLSAAKHLLLAGSGVATAIPLLWFAEGAKRLRFTTLGIVQYLAPTLQFLLAVALYGEPFTSMHIVTFGLIWSAVALYGLDTVWAARPDPSAAQHSEARHGR